MGYENLADLSSYMQIIIVVPPYLQVIKYSYLKFLLKALIHSLSIIADILLSIEGTLIFSIKIL